MALREGTHELGPDDGRLLIRTGRSGLGRRAGHDLTIEATRWSGTAVVADAPAQSSVEVIVEVDGLEVREGTGGVLPLSDADRAEIGRNLREVLRAEEHPEITFRSTRVEGTPEEFTVEGELTVAGRTEPLTVRAGTEDDRVKGEATVRQTRWGIKPYSAFFGALKLADDVRVSFDLAL
jgi:polyisoprenoid-binding protein YceI